MTPLPLTSLPVTWQLTALSLGVAVVLACGLSLLAAWLLRHRPVPVQYGLLLSALVLCLAAPLLTQIARVSGLGRVQVNLPVAPLPVARPEPVSAEPSVTSPAIVPAMATTTAPATIAPPRFTFSWRQVGGWVIAVWALGTVVAALRMLAGTALVWRLRRSSRAVAAPVLHAAAERARQVLGLRVTPRLLESELAPTPMVVGLTRPVIVLPAGLEQTLATDQLDAVLLHEAAHIAHRDPLIGLGQRLAAALFWWCPLLHAVNRRLNNLREDICDNYVIQTQGDGYRLARVLVDLAERAQSAARWRWLGAMAITEPGRTGIEARVRRLLQTERNTVTRMNLAAVCATTAFAALLGGVMLVTTVRADEASPFTGVKEIRLSRGAPDSPKAETVTIKEPVKLAELLATIKLEKDDPCKCDHDESAVFVKDQGEIKVALCEHCFDFAGKTYRMPAGFYQLFKAHLGAAAETAARAALQLRYDAEAQLMRATRPIALPSDCSAATNDDFTVTKTIDTITLQGDRATVTVTDRTAINAKRKTSSKTIVIENVVVTKEDWERDAEGKWNRVLITGHSSQHFEDGKLVEAPKLQSSHDGPATEIPATQKPPPADSWGRAVNGLQTRLTAEKDRVKAGEPIRLKLELRNVGTENRSFDAQQVAVNNPLIVRGPKGEEIPFVAGRVSTLGGGHSIKPGETVVLFDGLDAAGQYLLAAPGVHTFQFRGIGEEGFAFRGKGEPSIPPSNTIRVELTGEPPATVQATRAFAGAGAIRVRILSGSDRDPARDAVEEWIAKGLADAGSPVTSALTDWMTLSDHERELYSSMRGGRIIKGRVNDKGEVEITGMKIGQSPRIIAVRSGQKQVVKLTNYPGAGNVFIAVEAGAGAPGEEIAWGKETNGVVANLRALKTDVQSGDPIEFEIQVKNVSQKDVYLLSREGGKKMDALCWSFQFDQWEWSPPNPANMRRPLKPGETASVRCVVRTTRDDLSPDQKYRHWVAPFRNVKTNAESVRLPAGNYRVYARWGGVQEIPGDLGPVETNPIEVRITDHRESKQPALVITDADNGKTVQATVGQEVVVSLKGERKQTGWEVSQGEGEALRPLKPGGTIGDTPIPALEFTPDKEGVDDIGTYTFRYTAVAKGTSTLRFVYVYPGGSKPPPRTKTALVREFRVTVEVGAPVMAPSASADVKAAEAEVADAARNLARVTELVRQGLAPMADQEKAQADLARAKLRLELAKADADAARHAVTVKLAELDVVEAERRLARVSELFRQALVPAAEKEQAERELARAKAALAATSATRPDAAKPAARAEDALDQQIRSGRVVEGKPLALDGGLALSCFCQVQAAPPTPKKATPLIVGVRVTNTGKKDIEFQPAPLRLMLKWGDGPMQAVGINQDGLPGRQPPLVLKPGEKWTWIVADAQLNYGGQPVYLSFMGTGYLPGQVLERELKGNADRIAFAAQYQAGKAMSQPCEPVVCRLTETEETRKGAAPAIPAADPPVRVMGADNARREAIAGVVWYFDQEFAKPEAQRNSLLKQFLGDRTIADLFVHRAELDQKHYPPCCRVWLGRPADQIDRWDIEANLELKYQLVSGWGQGQGPVGDVKALMNVPTAEVRKWSEYAAVVAQQKARQTRLEAIWPRTEAEAARILKAVRPELAENVAGMSKFDYYFPDWVQRQMRGPKRENLCEFQFALDAKDQPRLRLMHQWNYEPKEKLPAIDDAKAWEKVASEYLANVFGRAPAGKLEVYSPKNLPPDYRNRKDDSIGSPFLRFAWTEQRDGQAADARQVMTFEVHEQGPNRYWIWCTDTSATGPAPTGGPPQATQSATKPAAVDPKTASLADALTDWIALLEKDDSKTATARWAMDATVGGKMTAEWKGLRECHKQHDYRRWIENSSDEPTTGLIPGGARRIGKDTTFRVGGHGFGHLHIMWEKTHSGWRIVSILECM